MCMAMFMATGSFFFGQAQVFPEPIRIMPPAGDSGALTARAHDLLVARVLDHEAVFP